MKYKYINYCNLLLLKINLRRCFRATINHIKNVMQNALSVGSRMKLLLGNGVQIGMISIRLTQKTLMTIMHQWTIRTPFSQ